MRDGAARRSACASIGLAASGALLRGKIATPDAPLADAGDENNCRLGSRDNGVSKDDILVMLDALDSIVDETYE